MIKYLTSIIQTVQGRLVRHYRDSGSLKNLLLHSGLTLTATSSLSYLLGLVRDKTFAYQFGASSLLDVYNAAFVVPDFLFAVLVSGALASAFVPVFTALDEESRQKAFKYINQVLSFLLTILFVFGVIFAILLPYLVPYLVPGFDAVQRAAYVTTTRLLLLAPLFFTLSNTFGNALISTRDFLWYGLAPVLYNVGIVLGALILVPLFGLSGLVWGTVFGSFLHMLVRAVGIWRVGYRPRAQLGWSKELGETLALMLPKMVQIGAWQLMLWWFIRLATTTGEGSVTIYNFAYNFQSVPVSLVGIAIALSSYARLSHLAAHDDHVQFKLVVRESAVRIVVLTTLSAIALAIIAYPLVNFFLGGGRFDDVSVRLTATLLSVYAISVPLESLMHLLSRAHYALRNTLRPSLIQIVSIISAMGISSYALPRLGLYALPLGFSAGFALQCVLLAVSLVHLLKRWDKAGIGWIDKILTGIAQKRAIIARLFTFTRRPH